MKKGGLVTAGAIAALVVALLAMWLRPDPSDNTTRSAAGSGAGAAPQRRYLRMAVTHDAAAKTVAVVDTALIDTSVDVLSGAGRFFAVLDTPDGPFAAVPIAFTPEAIIEFEGDGVAHAEVETIARPTTMVYLPFTKGATGVRVLDERGTTVASLDGAALTQVARKAAAPPATTVWQRVRDTIEVPVHAQTLAGLQAAYPHIQFLTSNSQLAWNPRGPAVTVVSIDSGYAASLAAALSALSPLLLGSIGSVAIVDYPAYGIGHRTNCGGNVVSTMERGRARGNQIVINAKTDAGATIVTNTPQQILTTLAHESVHAFNNLVDNPGAPIAQLPPAIQILVMEARQRLQGVEGALEAVWKRLQESSREVYPGYGKYEGDDAFCTYPSIAAAVAAGFAKPYGATKPREDFATYVQIFYDPQQSGPASNAVCQLFGGLTNQIPKDKVLPFAKLNYLRALGVIGEPEYLACVQQADPATQRGFQIGPATFINGLKGATTTSSATQGTRFVVIGESAQSQALLEVYSRPPSTSILGFHRLDNTIGWLTPYQETRGLKRRNLLTVGARNPRGAIRQNSLTRISTGGFALIVDDLAGQTKGYAFYVSFDDWQDKHRALHDLIWFNER